MIAEISFLRFSAFPRLLTRIFVIITILQVIRFVDSHGAGVRTAELHEVEPTKLPVLLSAPGELMAKLFASYNKATYVVRPLVVHMNVLLIKVKATIEKEGIFESVIALFIDWQDPRLTWDPSDYGNISTISLDPDQVGTPDIAMTNAADHLYSITRDYRFSVRLTYDGSLKFVPTGTSHTWCDLHLVTFPFDYQNCSLEFESWSLDSSSLAFDGLSELLLDTSFDSQTWTICQYGATTYLHTYHTGETFSRVRFDIKVKRKSTFYIINLIFPCATLSMIQMAVYIISSTDTTADRISFGTTNLLTLVVFQTILTEEMPKTSDAVTSLSKYIIALIVMSAIGIFESVAIERLMKAEHVPPPRFLRFVLKPIPILFRESPTKAGDDEMENNYEIPTILTKEQTPPSRNSSLDTLSINQHRYRKQASMVSLDPEDEPLMPVQYFGEQPAPDGKLQKSMTAVFIGHNNKFRLLNSFTNPNQGQTRCSCERIPSSGISFDQESRNRAIELQQLEIERRQKLAYKGRNSRLWKEVALKLDVVCFSMCLTLAVVIPGSLFLPLIFYESDESLCSQLHTNISNVS